MSPAIRDNRRTTARVVLFMVVAVMTTLVLFSGGPIGAISFAQQQTTTPAGPQIRWVNPDSETSEEISAKDDDPGTATDTSYHLVAWVSEVPANATVLFQYQSGTNTPVTIGTATRVGPDTYEYFWPGSQMPPDGAYTLIAILSSGGQEVSRDTQSARVNNQDDSTQPVRDFRNDQGETVEIVDPANADVLGFYDPPGDARPVAGIQVRFSSGAGNIRAFFTISRPGTEPQFTSCGNSSSGESSSDASDGVRCTLPAGVNPNEVTGVAVVATDQPLPGDPDIDAGDAHRVTGYEADPTTVTIDPALIDNQPAGTCTRVITATVTDQFGSRVVGLDVDAHAQGPDETLAFDDDDSSSNSTSRSKPPENHPTEAARNCEASSGTPPAAGSQGLHDDGSLPRKHIEALNGTADNGTFRFRLFSGTAGGTQFTVWADEDQNDRYCNEEAFGDGSVGWNQSAPAVTGVVAEESICPRPTATGTSTTTTSPSASPSSASPSSSPTTTSPSPTQTASPTPTEPPPPVREDSTVSIRYNGRAFKGAVNSDDPRCERGRRVLLKKKRPGRDATVGSDRTNRRGAYSIPEPRANGTYYTVATKKKTRVAADGSQTICTKSRSRNRNV